MRLLLGNVRAIIGYFLFHPFGHTAVELLVANWESVVGRMLLTITHRRRRRRRSIFDEAFNNN